MKISQKYYRDFKNECDYWIDKMQLNNWRIEVYVDSECESDRAYVKRNCLGMASEIFLCTKWIEESNDSVEEITRQIKESAKHECIHLLLGVFGYLAYERYVSEDELQIAEEGLVRKLEKLI